MELFENPLARMYGPDFLILFAILYALDAIFIWFIAPILASRTKEQEPPPLSPQPDPYELAYLRDGERGLITLAAYTLIKRKYIALLTNKTKSSIRVKKKDENANYGLLNDYEKVVYNALTEEMAFVDLVSRKQTVDAMKSISARLRSTLQYNGLVWSEQETGKFNVYKWAGIVLIGLLGLYKFLAAISHGHNNVAGIFFIALIASIILSKIKLSEAGRATEKGRALLNKTKQVFGPLSGDHLQSQGEYTQQLLLGVYGFMLLQGSSLGYVHSYMNTKLPDSSSIYFDNSSSGCAGSSGCSGGGGCGGGCGGCGGCS